MFCKSCGKYNPDKESKCKYCGGQLSVKQEVKVKEPVYGDDKTTIGVVMNLLLGVIGLIIGVIMYKNIERQTFLEGWLKCLKWQLIISAGVLLLALGVTATAGPM